MHDVNHRRSRTVRWLVTGLGALTLVACQPPRFEDHSPGQASFVRGGESLVTEGEPIPIVAVGRYGLTLDDVTRRLESLPRHERERLSSATARSAFTDSLAALLALAQRGEERGYEQDPAVRAAINEALADVSLDRLIDETATPRVTDDEVAAYFEAHRERFQRPARIALMMVLVAEADEARELYDRARWDLTREPLGERVRYFRELVAEHNIDENVTQQRGDLGFFERDELEAVFGEATATNIFENTESVGRVYGPVHTVGGSAVLMVTELRRAVDRPFEVVSDEIRQILTEQRRDEARAEWLRAAREAEGIRYDEAVMAILRSPPGPTQPVPAADPARRFDEVSLDALLTPVYDPSRLPDLRPIGADDGTNNGTGQAALEGSGSAAVEWTMEGAAAGTGTAAGTESENEGR